jgi:broad specificity phosphatase PhoE
MSRIFLMRHATPENPAGVLYGNRVGYPLSEVGKAQAQEAGEFLSNIPIDVVVSSPRERTLETAGIVVAANMKHPGIIQDDRLRDLDPGELAGNITFDDWRVNRDKYWEMSLAQERSMESPVATQRRMREVFDDYFAQYPDKNLLFVSHADPIVFLIEDLTNMPLAPGKREGGGFRMKRGDIIELIVGEPYIAKTIFTPTV